MKKILPTLDIARRQSMRKKRKLKRGGTGSWAIASGYTYNFFHDNRWEIKYLHSKLFWRTNLIYLHGQSFLMTRSKYLKDKTLALGDDIFDGNPVVLDME